MPPMINEHTFQIFRLLFVAMQIMFRLVLMMMYERRIRLIIEREVARAFPKAYENIIKQTTSQNANKEPKEKIIHPSVNADKKGNKKES